MLKFYTPPVFQAPVGVIQSEFGIGDEFTKNPETTR